jgi:hypothetical protein
LASTLDIYSRPRGGTALLAQLLTVHANGGKLPSPVTGMGFDYEVINLPKSGEVLCGDSYAVYNCPDGGVQVMVVDGLGHGPLAAEAAERATAVFKTQESRSLTNLMEGCHTALQGSRGAALAIAHIDIAKQQVIFTGVGNINALIWSSDDVRIMVSHNGTVGVQIHRMQEFTYPWARRARLVMHSDGLSAQMKLNNYSDLAGRSPGLIAGVLYRDFSRDRDDATIFVLRER